MTPPDAGGVLPCPNGKRIEVLVPANESMRPVFVAAKWLATCALVLASVLAPAGPARATPDIPGSLPDSLTQETHEGFSWVYPPEAADRVETLQEVQQETWTRITSELGAPAEGEVVVRVGRNPEQMQALAPPGVTLPSYAVGVALSRFHLILLTLTAPETWEPSDLESVFQHELSHLALHRAVDGAELPRWLSEGVAIHQADQHSIARIRSLWEATVRGNLQPLDKLSRTFPARHHDVNAAYAQSADFVSFMLDGDDDAERFRGMLDQVRQGAPFEQAIEEAYGVPLGYLEREWRVSVHERYGRLPLLLTSLTGLWALGAVLLVVAYIRRRRRDKHTLARWEQEEALVESEPPAPEAARHTPVYVPAAHMRAGARARRASRDSEIPTIEYEGRNHTLH